MCVCVRVKAKARARGLLGRVAKLGRGKAAREGGRAARAALIGRRRAGGPRRELGAGRSRPIAVAGA